MRVIETLNEQYKIVQDTSLYRFTSDAVLLSRFVRAKKNEVVADFCAGSGIVGLNFFAENTGVASVTFFERSEELSALCRETVALNRLEEKLSVVTGDVALLAGEYNERFSLILCNPPYEGEGRGFENANPEKAPCRKELTLTLPALCAAAKRCLKYGGRFVLCHRADRLSEVFCALTCSGLEPKKCQLVSGKRGKKPYLALVCAVKGGAAGIDMLPEAVNVNNCAMTEEV